MKIIQSLLASMALLAYADNAMAGNIVISSPEDYQVLSMVSGPAVSISTILTRVMLSCGISPADIFNCSALPPSQNVGQ